MRMHRGDCETCRNTLKHVETLGNMPTNIQLLRVCEECGNRFIAKTTVTKFCSLACNRKNYKKRIKLTKIKSSDQETIQKLKSDSNTSKDFLSIKDACSLLSVSRTTLWRIIKKEQIKVTKIGSRSILSRQSINNLFN